MLKSIDIYLIEFQIKKLIGENHSFNVMFHIAYITKSFHTAISFTSNPLKEEERHMHKDEILERRITVLIGVNEEKD